MAEYDDFDDDWREDLKAWRAPRPGPDVERRLREAFRLCLRPDRGRLWAGRVAVAVLTMSAAVLVRVAGPARDGLPQGGRVVAATVTTDSVRTSLDLTGFEPVRQPRLRSAVPAVSEMSLEGFVPVLESRLMKVSGGTR
jgi:hypothetical protein